VKFCLEGRLEQREDLAIDVVERDGNEQQADEEAAAAHRGGILVFVHHRSQHTFFVAATVAGAVERVNRGVRDGNRFG
jgi:hypothetical protein